jgi:CRP/FNR family transcriptional regulator
MQLKMKKEKTVYDQEPAFLYHRCMPEWWPALDTQKKIVRCKKGDLIFKEGDPVKGVYFLIDGVVKVHKHWGVNKELIIRFAARQDIFGHRGLSSHSNIYPISATALCKSSLCFLDLPFFHSTLKVNTGFMFEFMMFFADELQLSEQRMRDLAHMPVKNRVAKTLLALEKKFGVDKEGFIGFQVSRQDIASYTGAAYETVYKLLSEMTKEGIIKTNGKSIGFLEKEKLLENQEPVS